MKILRFLPLALASVVLLLSLSSGIGVAAERAAAASAPAAAAAGHIVTGPEIQSQIDQKIHSETADRQAIRELLARPEVRRVAGNAGLDLQRANAAVGVLSGPELSRLAMQARQANSEIVGGAVTMTWTMVIIIVVALVVLIAIL